MSNDSNDNKIRLKGGNREYRMDMSPRCPHCDVTMKYSYGETFECPVCGQREPTEFGLVRAFLEKAGPQPALIISEYTGVPVNIIDEFLRQGRVEIPDGSSVYIRCELCGKDIRYGKYCPECAARMSKETGKLTLSDMGECPTNKPDMSGKMHMLDAILNERKK